MTKRILVLIFFLLLLAVSIPAAAAQSTAPQSFSMLPADQPATYTVFFPVAARDFYPGMVKIPAGNFIRGCDPAHNAGLTCDASEMPSKTIYLDAYYMDVTEVTNGQYAQCEAEGACSAPRYNSSFKRTSYYDNPAYANYPVIYVYHHQAAAYCSWAGKRLPTEAEWEKAARGSIGARVFPWGDTAPSCSLANYWYGLASCGGDTEAVESYAGGASPYGVLNMSGNVAEWVSDWYGDTYYSTGPTINPTGPTHGEYYVLRGGSWFSPSGELPVSRRIRYGYATSSNGNIGFRCAITAP